MAIPQRSIDERREALKKANSFRSSKAQLKKDLKSQKIGVEQLIKAQDEIFLNMKAKELLQSLPGIGEFSARKILEQCRIKPSRKVGALGKRQKSCLWQTLGITA